MGIGIWSLGFGTQPWHGGGQEVTDACGEGPHPKFQTQNPQPGGRWGRGSRQGWLRRREGWWLKREATRRVCRELDMRQARRMASRLELSTSPYRPSDRLIPKMVGTGKSSLLVMVGGAVPTALKMGPHLGFRDPWFALQVAGFRRAPVNVQGLKKEDLVPLAGGVGEVVAARCGPRRDEEGGWDRVPHRQRGLRGAAALDRQCHGSGPPVLTALTALTVLTVCLTGNVACAAQQPWIVNATVPAHSFSLSHPVNVEPGAAPRHHTLCAGVPRPQENAFSQDPTVGLPMVLRRSWEGWRFIMSPTASRCRETSREAPPAEVLGCIVQF